MLKRVVLFAGAVLVLAACDSATAPSISRFDGNAAATKAKPKTGTGSGTVNSMTGCTGGATGYWLRGGPPEDSSWVPCVLDQ